MTLTWKCSTALVGCNVDGFSRFPWDEQGAKLREVESKVAWIQSVNLEPLSKRVSVRLKVGIVLTD